MIAQDRGTGGLAPSLTLPRSTLQGRELSVPPPQRGDHRGAGPLTAADQLGSTLREQPGMLLAPGTTRKGGCAMSDPAIKLTALADCAG